MTPAPSIFGVSSFDDLVTTARSAPLVVAEVWSDLIPSLASEILELSQGASSYPSKNIGGWKSNEEVLSAGPALRVFGARLRDELFDHRPTGRAMVNRTGSEHPAHQHRLATISGVFYVATGYPLVPTIFRLRDHTELPIVPVPGRMVLFSGDTWHRVPRYDGTVPRITIAFDLVRGRK